MGEILISQAGFVRMS